MACAAKNRQLALIINANTPRVGCVQRFGTVVQPAVGMRAAFPLIINGNPARTI